MAYQTAITVKKVLERIYANEYVLPAIQREFVWEPPQICRLFDSLLRGYPIGTFLFWSVSAERSKDFQFYGFLREYHQLKERHSPKYPVIDPKPITAILDGQQRLTSLNIGLCGSYASKRPYRPRNDPSAYPKKVLHLNLTYIPSEEDEAQYEFEFLTEEQAKSAGDDRHWYAVPQVLSLSDGPQIFEYIQSAGLAAHPRAFYALDALHRAVHKDGVVSYYEEEDQDLNRVLDIFVRVNSGGTVLSKSDLLLSIATADWASRDAREAVNGLVDDLNATHQGFNFSKDLVLKTGLMMTDLPDVRFTLANFTKENMSALDQRWDDVDASLRRAAKLLARFGFSERNLTANSVLIPIADYLGHRGLDDSFLTGSSYTDDRAAIRSWVIRSLTRRGIWGSGLDQMLTRIRAVIRSTSGGFPVSELESALLPMGKTLRFTREDLPDLLEAEYKQKRVFPLLTLLYPGVDVRNDFHVDHVFPQALFTPTKLAALGVPDAKIAEYRARLNQLPNLQLLEGTVNSAKLDTHPLAWVTALHADTVQRDAYLAGHDLLGLPEGMDQFLEFFELRRQRMSDRLVDLLQITS